jgi:hypothetical protein
MAEDRVTIDFDTLLDNEGERQVEFSGSASGEAGEFAVQYDVLEALSGHAPDGDGAALLRLHADAIALAAGKALARGNGIGRIVVSGSDI